MPATYTPIRYPGGKTKIYPLVDAILERNGLIGSTYAEAYCGGAGLAIKLLLNNRVSRIVLNDIDPAVYSIWHAILNNSAELCEFIESVPLTIDEWKRQRDTLQSEESPSFELGKAAFYLNRTNRSGILRGGPIGGLSQSGKYRINARFNREALCNKVNKIAERSCCIDLYNMDAIDFINRILMETPNLFVNFDPPYVEKGPGLYHNAYTMHDHFLVADAIRKCAFPWIVTYDDSEQIRALYQGQYMGKIKLGYSAAVHKTGSELMIFSDLVLPSEGIEAI